MYRDVQQVSVSLAIKEKEGTDATEKQQEITHLCQTYCQSYHPQLCVLVSWSICAFTSRWEEEWKNVRDPDDGLAGGGGFVIVLTYGSHVDWLRNLQAVGHGSLRWHQQEYVFQKPEFIDAPTALAALPPFIRQVLKMNGAKQFIRISSQRVAESPRMEHARFSRN